MYSPLLELLVTKTGFRQAVLDPDEIRVKFSGIKYIFPWSAAKTSTSALKERKLTALRMR